MGKDYSKSSRKNHEGPAQKRWMSIQAKCHPASFELAQLLKDSIRAMQALGPNPPGQISARIERKVHGRLQEIHRKYSGSASPAPDTFPAQVLFSKMALKSESDDQGVKEWIHWKRHKRPMKQDVRGMQTRDWEASRRVLRTVGDSEQLRCGKGPIRPFKGDIEHSTVFETLWGLGLERLTTEELTDFFDKYCPCGTEIHDPESLKKQRARFRKALQKALALNNDKKS